MLLSLLDAFYSFMRPNHPCSLAPAVSRLSATQQLPLVRLLEPLLEGPERWQRPPEQPPEEGAPGSLSYRGKAARVLASRCIAKGRKEHCQAAQAGLLGAARRQLEAAEAATGGQPGACGPAPATLLQRSALELAAVLLTDAAEAASCGRGASGAELGHSHAAVITPLATTLPYLRSMLAAAAAAVCAGDSDANWEAGVATLDVIRSWCAMGSACLESSPRALLPTPACLAVASGAAAALLRLAPLLPCLPVSIAGGSTGSDPDEAGDVLLPAGSPEVCVAGCRPLADVLAANPPQALAGISARLAGWLLRAEALCEEPAGGSSREQQPAAPAPAPAAAGSAHSCCREGLAGAAWSTAVTAFKFQWALDSQAAAPVLEGSVPTVFSLRSGGFAAGGHSRIAHEACDTALAALLAELDESSDLQHALDVQR